MGKPVDWGKAMTDVETIYKSWQAEPGGGRLHLEVRPESVQMTVHHPDCITIYEFKPRTWVSLVELILALCEEQGQDPPVVKVWCNGCNEREALSGGDPVTGGQGCAGRRSRDCGQGTALVGR